ncbi:Uncharacterised protein [uncultured archaeon]|nr:Uncharacterised protein [uncultured archaeon]
MIMVKFPNNPEAFLENKKPRINAPSHASGGRIHVCPQAYVSMRYGEHDADERRYTDKHLCLSAFVRG